MYNLMVMALHGASTLLSARQTAPHGDVCASGATICSQIGRNAQQRGIPLCVPSLTGSVLVVSLVFGCPDVSSAPAGSGAGGSPRRTVGLSLPPSRVHIGMASWYGRRWQERPTASGARDDRSPRTAAHRTAPLGTQAVVTTLANGPMVRARITDRGPHTPRRICDLSSEAARRLAMVRTGAARVKIACLTASSPLA
jgi:rare lipoprotein A